VLLAKGLEIAGLPEQFVRSEPRPFSAFGLSVHLLGTRPQVTLSWQLTGAGEKVLGPVVDPLAGRDLAHENAFIDAFLKPVVRRARKTLTLSGPYAGKAPQEHFREGGGFMWPLTLAALWPRVLQVKPVRKLILHLVRHEIRPARYIRRVNVHRQARLLQVRLEGRMPSG
jgi:hypothetical protein